MKELLKTILYKPLYNLLVFLAWLIPGHSVGWAIIALTLLVRLALWPSSMKATRAQKKMRDLAPEIRIDEKLRLGALRPLQRMMELSQRETCTVQT